MTTSDSVLPFVALPLLLVTLGVLCGALVRMRTGRSAVVGAALGVVAFALIGLGALDSPPLVPRGLARLLAAPVAPLLLGVGFALGCPPTHRAVPA